MSNSSEKFNSFMSFIDTWCTTNAPLTASKLPSFKTACTSWITTNTILLTAGATLPVVNQADVPDPTAGLNFGQIDVIYGCYPELAPLLQSNSSSFMLYFQEFMNNPQLKPFLSNWVTTNNPTYVNSVAKRAEFANAIITWLRANTSLLSAAAVAPFRSGPSENFQNSSFKGSYFTSKYIPTEYHPF